MYGDSLGTELDDLPLHSSQYGMSEFAKKYFREAQRNRLDTSRQKHTDKIMANNVRTRPDINCLIIFYP